MAKAVTVAVATPHIRSRIFRRALWCQLYPDWLITDECANGNCAVPMARPEGPISGEADHIWQFHRINIVDHLPEEERPPVYYHLRVRLCPMCAARWAAIHPRAVHYTWDGRDLDAGKADFRRNFTAMLE
jgi:hypothetical protein